MLNLLRMPVQASAHAAEIDHMTVLVHWLMLFLFIGWGIFFLFVLLRFRSGANPRASYTGAKGKISKGLEVAVAVIEVILLVFYAIPAWAKRVNRFPSESEAVEALASRISAKDHEPNEILVVSCGLPDDTHSVQGSS